MRFFAIVLALIAFMSLPAASSAAGDGARPDPVEAVLGAPSAQPRQLAQSCSMGYSACMDECRGSYDACRVVQSESTCTPRYRNCTGGCRRRHC